MKSYINKVAFLLFTVMIIGGLNSYAQNNSSGAPVKTPAVLDDIRSETQRVALLTGWESAFFDQLEEAIARLQNTQIDDEAFREFRLIIYNRLLQHYKQIERANKSRIKTDFEEELLQWLNPLAIYLHQGGDAVDNIIKGFPDSYFPARILAPELLTDSALNIMSDLYPKEVLYAIRYMIEPDALFEAELAAINAPYEAKQYFHYHNSVNSLLKKSEDERIKKLYEVFSTYRYGSNSFYLLHPIFEGELTMDEAHTIGKDREQLYNAMVSIFTEEDAIGKYSVEEHLSELSDKYVRKLMFQRYLSSSMLKLDALAVFTDDARIYFLFRSQNMLKKKDLQNLVKLIKRLEPDQVADVDVDWLPIGWIEQLNVRLDEEELHQEFDFYIAESVWGLTRKVYNAVQLTDFTNPFMMDPEITDELLNKPVYVFQPYRSSLSENDKQMIRMENNPYELLADLSKVTGKIYSREMILSMAMEHPVEVIAQLEKFQDQPYATEVCHKMALNAPLTAKNYIVKKGHRIHSFLKNSENENIKTLYAINDSMGNWTRAYILLDNIMRKELTLKEAHEICKSNAQLLPYLVQLYKREDFLGKYTVEKELEYASLKFVRKFNISENTDHGFRDDLMVLDAQTLYTFMIFGEREIISQTFSKMYEQLMVLTGQDLSYFFESMNHVYVDRFLRMAVHYGKESDLVRRLSPSGLEMVWTTVFRNLEISKGNEIKKAIEAGEIIIWLQNQQNLERIHDIIREEYERLVEEHHDEGVAAYGILASIMAQKLRSGWSVYAAPYYEIPNLIAMPIYSLFNEKLVNIQHYYFYNDRDGLYSYRNFLRQYERSNYNWKIEDKGSYVKISSKSGKTVEIYANKPTEGESGIAILEEYLMSNNLQPQVVVHRGLSTHTLKTFRKIPASARLILDGSCGGFHIQSVALENAPGAHILCNRNIGTMHINDPMFKQISESIRQGRDIVWPSFWSEMEARLGTNPYFKDYIPPHKNVAALIIKAYYDVLDINN